MDKFTQAATTKMCCAGPNTGSGKHEKNFGPSRALISGALSLCSLSIHSRKAVWVLYVDCTRINHDGNAFDSALLAMLGSLRSNPTFSHIPLHWKSPLRFHFEDIRKLPPPVIAFDEVASSYSGKPEDYLYKKLSFGVDSLVRSVDSRVAILGANCARKSTLLNLITGVLQPCQGTIPMLRSNLPSIVNTSRTSYLTTKVRSSTSNRSSMRSTPRRTVWHGGSNLAVVARAVRIKRASSAHWSDGLSNRDETDEPTNHLDMASTDVLALAIKDFEGGVMIVSRDFRLINQVA
ncbi:hypothetical protein C8R48DRAFT_803139 [Suillus tomentosus]|nr:hypothetical protein C8R48DRAFT_803139 [Suillus tomentosus]